MSKRIYIPAIILLLTAFIGYRLYNKPHRKANTEPFISIQASELFNSFAENEVEANENYLDKVIEVHGVISSISLNQDGALVIVLQSSDPLFGVSCTLEKTSKDFTVGDTIHLKGICKGYLSDVVLTDCIYLKN